MKLKSKVLVAATGATALVTGVAVAAASPTVVTGKASSIGQHSAVLHGTVNPNASRTTYYFQWGLTSAYGVNGKAHALGEDTKAASVAETASGLIPGTPYHYRVVATNAFGTSVGSDHAFTTAGHPPPGVATGPVTSISSTGATLTGVVNPQGEKTTYTFQYGPATTYANETPPVTIPASTVAQSVSVPLSPLAPQTIYHYRLVATHAGSATSDGLDETFMTFPTVPPTPRVRATTRPRHATHRPFVLSTSGTVSGPSWIPSTYACSGNLTFRFFRGRKQVGFTIVPLGSDCKFAGQTVFGRVPGRSASRPAHLRVVIRYLRNGYLAGSRAPIEHLSVG